MIEFIQDHLGNPEKFVTKDFWGGVVIGDEAGLRGEVEGLMGNLEEIKDKFGV